MAQPAPTGWAGFFAQAVWNTLVGPRLFRSAEAGMAHWRKRNPTAGRFNACLARGAVLLAVAFGTLIVVVRHYA